MKHKVSELTGALLDAAVAKCEGDALPDFWRDPEDGSCWLRPGREEWTPSTDWGQAGPIVEKHLMSVGYDFPRDYWCAVCYDSQHRQVLGFDHRSPLIAAMRAYVASKFGDEVDLP